jgi:hypothetical protein
MGEALDRLMVAALVGVGAVLIGLVWNRGRAWVRRRRRFSTLEPGTYLLTADGCVTCSRARERLTTAGLGFVELTHEARPDVFDHEGIGKVPALVVVTENGGWVAFGVPSLWALRRWPTGP